jgi:death-on-curing protein
VRDPPFVELDDVLAIHASRIDRYGGSHGIRDVRLLESALATPRASFSGELLHGTLHEMAAAYLYHIVKNHPFIDGNKRTGLAVAIAFLALNGRAVDAEEDDLVALVLGIAEGSASKAQAAVFFEDHTRPA